MKNQPKRTDLLPQSANFSQVSAMLDDFLNRCDARIPICPIVMIHLLSSTPYVRAIDSAVGEDNGNLGSFIDLRGMSKQERLQTIERFQQVFEKYKAHVEAEE